MMAKCKWWPNDDLILTKWWANDDLLPQAPAPPAPRVAPAVGGGAGGLAAQRVHLLHPRQGEAAGHLHQRSRAVSGNLISMWKIRKNVYNFLSNCLIVKNMEKMSLIYNIFCHIFSPVSVLTIVFRNNMYYGMVLSYFYKYILWLHKILCQREKNSLFTLLTICRADTVYRLCYSSILIHWRSYMMHTRDSLFQSLFSFDMVTICQACGQLCSCVLPRSVWWWSTPSACSLLAAGSMRLLLSLSGEATHL